MVRRYQEGKNDLGEGKEAEPHKTLRPKRFFVVNDVIVVDKYEDRHKHDERADYRKDDHQAGQAEVVSRWVFPVLVLVFELFVPRAVVVPRLT